MSTGRTWRVLGFVGEPMNGVGYVRFHQPFRHLRPLGFELRTLGAELQLVPDGTGYSLKPECIDGLDAVMFPQMVASPRLGNGSRVDLVTPTCEMAVKRGLKIIYSLDDCPWEIDGCNPGYERVVDSIENSRTLLERADALFVTTSSLSGALSGHGKPIHLLPNAIDTARWRPRPRTADQRRIGWAGSGSHIADLLMLLPAIGKLQRKVPFHFVLQGLTPRPIAAEAEDVRRALRGLDGSRLERARAFLELCGMLDEIDHTHIPFASLDAYVELLPRLDLDIGVCPLADTEFNRYKSALKFYEYAACGTMTIASDVEPYRHEVSVVTSNTRDAWCDVLERYLRDPAERDRELDRQREFVMAERDIVHLRAGWAEALRETIEAGITTCPSAVATPAVR